MLRQHNDARGTAISTRRADCGGCRPAALLRVLDEPEDISVQSVHVGVYEAVGRAFVDLEPAAGNERSGRYPCQRERG